MDLSCFLASSPYAEDAYQLYSEDNDNGNLWERTNQSAPLPTCSSPDAPDHGCDVCRRDGHVYAFCRHLLDKLKLVMETTGGDPITLEEMDCPVFLPDSPTDSPEQQPNFPTGSVTTIIIAVVAILLFLVVVGVVLYCKRCKRRNKHEIVQSEGGDTDAADAADAETGMDD